MIYSYYKYIVVQKQGVFTSIVITGNAVREKFGPSVLLVTVFNLTFTCVRSLQIKLLELFMRKMGSQFYTI